MNRPRDTLLAVTLAGLALTVSACGSSMMPASPSLVRPSADTPPAPSPPAPGAPTPPVPMPPAQPERTRYLVVFTSTWGPASHPADFPPSAHYSGLIGGTHSAAVTFWQEGAPASAGIQRMAERGSKSPLDAEVMHAIAAGTAQHLLSGPNLSGSPGSTSMEFEVTQSFPLVTLVTMIAPSPDWFVGVTQLPLFKNGEWVGEVIVDLFAHDAGTDSGISYESPDLATLPPQGISRITGYPAATNGQVRLFGTFTFKRIR